MSIPRFPGGLFPWRLRRRVTSFLVAFLLLFGLNLAGFGAPVSADVAARAAANWLGLCPAPMGKAAGSPTGHARTFYSASGEAQFYVVDLAPTGYVVLATDDQLEPIIAFSHEDHFQSHSGNPLFDLLQRDLGDRKSRIAKAAASGKTPSPETVVRNAKWQKLLACSPKAALGAGQAEARAESQPSIDDPRIDPLVQSRWNQSRVDGIAVYNYYTPPGAAGDPNNYVSGCVATSLAQIFRYHQWPQSGVGTQSFQIEVDSVKQQKALQGGNGKGGAYSWSNMTLVPDSTITSQQCQAIGALLSDVGVANYMEYGADESVAYYYTSSGENVVTAAVKNVFHYANRVASASPPELSDLTLALDSNLDAGLPAWLAIAESGENIGHAVVVDGYGYNNSTPYHHINMGWAGEDDAWYNLPTVDASDAGYTFNTVEEVVYNIQPAVSGQIVSGRITGADGNPVAGITVTAQGLQYSGTSDARGIYAIKGLPSSTTFTLAPANMGSIPGSTQVTTGASWDGGPVGNVTGINFQVAPNVNLVPCVPSYSGSQGIVISSTKAASGVVTPDKGPLFTTDTLYANWGVRNLGVGNVTIPTCNTLYLDGSLFVSETCNSINGKAAVAYNNVLLNNPLSPLSPGTHTLAAYVNADYTVAETNTTDNVYTSTFVVCVPDVVTATVNPIGTGSVNGAGNYLSGTTVTVTAQPARYYTFLNWTDESGSVVSSDTSYSFQVAGNPQLVANFIPSFDLVPLAASSGSAPGVDGAEFSTFGSPSINDNNHVAFQATISSGNSGIWADSGTAQGLLVALTGSAAPGVDSGIFATLADPVYNNADQVAFIGTLKTGKPGVAKANATGIWANTSGTLGLVALTGTEDTGDSGVVFTGFQQLVLPDRGGAIFLASLGNAAHQTGVNSSNNLGIWADNGNGQLQPVMRKGTPWIAGSKVKVTTLSLFADAAATKVRTQGFNSSGNFIYYVGYSNGMGSVCEAFSSGSTQNVELSSVVMSKGDSAPHVQGATFSSFGHAALNDANDIAFLATISGQGIQRSNNTGIWAETGTGGWGWVVRTGIAQLPGIPKGAFTALSDPVLSDTLADGTEQIAFLGTLNTTVPGVVKANASGVWVASSGSLAAVAGTGEQAPDCPKGTLFASFTQLALPAQGGVVFVATLTGAGVKTANNEGVWAVNTAGDLRLIVRKGDQTQSNNAASAITTLSVWTSSTATMPQPGGYNGIGNLIYKAAFKDRAQGIFTVEFPTGQPVEELQ